MMGQIEIGDIVLARGVSGSFHAVVTAVRLGRLAVERCDGRPAGPLSPRDVVTIFKPAGGPQPVAPSATPRLRPTAQLRLELD
jgi:hypothetical protein